MKFENVTQEDFRKMDKIQKIEYRTWRKEQIHKDRTYRNLKYNRGWIKENPDRIEEYNRRKREKWKEMKQNGFNGTNRKKD